MQDSTKISGAAIASSNSSLHVADSDFMNNKANVGAGIFAETSDISIRRSSFLGNMADFSGGAIYLDSSLAVDISASVFSHNIVFGNQSSKVDFTGRGGAIFASRNSAQALHSVISIESTAFSFNRALLSGGAVHIDFLFEVNFRNVSFVSNEASGNGYCLAGSSCQLRGGAIYAKDAHMNITNCIFLKNAANTSSDSEFALGGAIYTSAQPSLGVYFSVFNSTFSNNTAEGIGDNNAGGFGGGIYIDGVLLQMSTCRFFGNKVRAQGLFADVSTNGGAVYISNSGDINVTRAIISDVVFHHNEAHGGRAGAIYITDQSNVTVHRCVFSNNLAVSSYIFKAQVRYIITILLLSTFG